MISRASGVPRVSALALLAMFISGCGLHYVPDVRQGNVVEAEQVGRLAPGMTRQNVLTIMGTPLIQDPFHADRWDYYYAFRPEGGELSEQRHVAVYFQGNVLTRVDDQRLGPSAENAEQSP